MDCSTMNSKAEGEVFYNQIQVMEFLIRMILSEFIEVNIRENEDSFTALEIVNGQEIKTMYITYLPGALNIDFDRPLTLFYKHYVIPFNRKFYKISEVNNFISLVQTKQVKNLYFILKSLFFKLEFVFQKLPKALFSVILSYLDRKSIITMLTLSRGLKELIDNPINWRNMYYSRYGNSGFKLPNLEWKAIYFSN